MSQKHCDKNKKIEIYGMLKTLNIRTSDKVHIILFIKKSTEVKWTKSEGRIIFYRKIDIQKSRSFRQDLLSSLVMGNEFKPL